MTNIAANSIEANRRDCRRMCGSVIEDEGRVRKSHSGAVDFRTVSKKGENILHPILPEDHFSEYNMTIFATE